MVSYADFHKSAAQRQLAMDEGLREYLRVPDEVQIYLDNGAFCFANSDEPAPLAEYEEFVNATKPDWRPIPRDYIPLPQMSYQKQRGCYDRTMRVNSQYQHNGYVPVIHIGKHLEQYIGAITNDNKLSQKVSIALGGIVPNLLRKPKALPYKDVLEGLLHVRNKLDGKQIHVFGVGGTATLHLIALLGFDSVDSSGWRNRAARGIIQLPGSGDRIIAELGNWRGRRVSAAELKRLAKCKCPACCAFGIDGLRASKTYGFSNRATHNLWVLLQETKWLQKHLCADSYRTNYRRRLDNSTYRPIIKELLRLLKIENQKAKSAPTVSS